MAELIHTFSKPVAGKDGGSYTVAVQGEESSTGTWTGWLEFRPVQGGSTLRTDRDTTQPDRDDLEYWASGLEEVYLEGALKRAVAI